MKASVFIKVLPPFTLTNGRWIAVLVSSPMLVLFLRRICSRDRSDSSGALLGSLSSRWLIDVVLSSYLVISFARYLGRLNLMVDNIYPSS